MWKGEVGLFAYVVDLTRSVRSADASPALSLGPACSVVQQFRNRHLAHVDLMPIRSRRSVYQVIITTAEAARF